ncbi:MAG: OmpA family protein [Bacteroidetes bacterium]|nr:OmpA family protein [Bacteroidota bacterium]
MSKSILTVALSCWIYATQAAHNEVSFLLYFETDKAELALNEQERLLRFAGELKGATKYYEITISGHTDAVGTVQYNTALAQNRAKCITQALIQQGVSPYVITEFSYSEKKPVLPNVTDEGKSKTEGLRLWCASMILAPQQN